jgi:hypothetical protein
MKMVKLYLPLLFYSFQQKHSIDMLSILILNKSEASPTGIFCAIRLLPKFVRHL